MTTITRLIAAAFLALAAEASAQDHQVHQADTAHYGDMATLFPPQEASGTSWQPALTPIAGVHGRLGDWTFMGHASVFAQFLYESGAIHRTSRQAGSINWFMGMLGRPAGRGRFGRGPRLARSERTMVDASFGGHLHESEAGLGTQPRQDVDRATVSAMYFRQTSGAGGWASTVAYGVNREINLIPNGQLEQTTHAFLTETAVSSGSGIHTWFARLDAVGKPAHDLHVHEYITSIFTVGKLQLGYFREVAQIRGWAPGIGAHVNLALVPPVLAPRYNGRVAPGLGVFVNVRPAIRRAVGMQGTK